MQITVFDKETAEYIGSQIVNVVPEQEEHFKNLSISWERGDKGTIELYCPLRLFMLLSSIKNLQQKLEV